MDCFLTWIGARMMFRKQSVRIEVKLLKNHSYLCPELGQIGLRILRDMPSTMISPF